MNTSSILFHTFQTCLIRTRQQHGRSIIRNSQHKIRQQTIDSHAGALHIPERRLRGESGSSNKEREFQVVVDPPKSGAYVSSGWRFDDIFVNEFRGFVQKDVVDKAWGPVERVCCLEWISWKHLQKAVKKR